MLKVSLSRPVLLIGSGHEWKCEGDGRACGKWQVKLVSSRSQSRRASHVIIRGVVVIAWAITDLWVGLALDAVLHPLHESGHEVSEVSGEAGSILFKIWTKDYKESIYRLYTRRGDWGNVWGSRQAAYSMRVGLQISKYFTKTGLGMSGSRDQKSKHK